MCQEELAKLACAKETEKQAVAISLYADEKAATLKLCESQDFPCAVAEKEDALGVGMDLQGSFHTAIPTVAIRKNEDLHFFHRDSFAQKIKFRISCSKSGRAPPKG